MVRIETSRSAARFALPALAVLILVGLSAPAAVGQECEVPLFVKQNLIGANLMLLVDNSQSMNAATYHMDYDPRVTYAGGFNSDSTYYVSKDGERTPDDFAWYLPSSPSAYLIRSDMGQSGQYSGNYLNWIYYVATDEQRNNIPQVTRIQVLKTTLADLIYRSQRLNLGLTVFFPNGDGGNVLAYCEGNNEMAVASVINGMVANAYTQLGEAMETILDYYVEGGDNGFPSIISECQYNFVVVVTDGLSTMDTNVSPYLHDADGDGMDPGSCTSIGAPYGDWLGCSDHFDDVAYYMAHNDIRDDFEGDQFVYTYVVGFHEDGRLLQDAAKNGLGLYFHAENSTELAMCIEYAIQDILRRISAGSAVAVVSTEQGSDDRLYRGKFMPVDWDGFLECYQLPYTEGEEAMWEAGNLLKNRTASSRDIFTALDKNPYDFVEGSASSLREAMEVATDEEAAELISWVRGNEIDKFRDRQGWVLGDIVHSTPVVVGTPATFSVEESYQTFRSNHEDRRKMVYVGANDGMLHAFDATDGEEVWAFMPEFALPKIQTMADSFYCHTFTCDQTCTVRDMKVGGVWKTVLATGGRTGGSSIFALDISNPESPDFLWQNTLPNDKSFASIVRLASIGGSAMALVGGGLDEDNRESWLYAYEVSSGALIGSHRLSVDKTRNKTTRPELVDLNLDGEIDLAYVADLTGDLYRFEFKDSASPGSWSYSRLYDGSLEITANPVAAYGPDGDIYVYFGTGAYLTDDDMETTVDNRFVCVYDKHDHATLDAGDLVNQTDSIDPINAARGWYVNLWNGEGERVTEQAAVVAETVVFTSFKPTMDPCVAGGESWLYQMAYDTGGFAPEAEESEDESDRSVDLGEGIASHPVVDLAGGTVVVQSSDASISVEEVAAAFDRLTVRSWQEAFLGDETTAPEEGGEDIQ